MVLNFLFVFPVSDSENLSEPISLSVVYMHIYSYKCHKMISQNTPKN